MTNTMTLKLGLDLHGVCDTYPEIFGPLSNFLTKGGHEVHIITGSELNDELKSRLKELGISYTHIFSIVTYHQNLGTTVVYDDHGNLWMKAELWDVTKAQYCKENNINLHIDDSNIYGKYFTTPYLRFKIDKSAIS